MRPSSEATNLLITQRLDGIATCLEGPSVPQGERWVLVFVPIVQLLAVLCEKRVTYQ